MVTEVIFINSNVNQWLNILRRTLEAECMSHKRISKCLSKLFLKNKKMSHENNTYNFIGTPSTSGSSTSTWNYNDSAVNASNPNQPVNENNEFKPEEYNLVLTQPPVMPLQGWPTNYYNLPFQGLPINYNLNYYQSNSFYYMSDYFSQQFNNYYCESTHQYRSRGQRNGQRLLSLRKWENVSKEAKSSKPGFFFTLMCYNVLAQDLLEQHPFLYNRHSRQSLDWSVRWNNLFNEISKFKPDVLCLQEVQQSHVDSYFSVLKSLGYSSLYKRRTGVRTDGCALFYKADLIQLIEHTTVEFNQPNIPILNRDNVAVIAKFAPKLHPTREFVVATTHLLYNPRRNDVKLAQIQVLLTEVERISYNAKSESNYLPVILTGDLNSRPDSPIYEFLVNGKLKYDELSPRVLKNVAHAVTGKVLVSADLRITDNCQHADLLTKRLNNETISRSEEVSIIELFHSERTKDADAQTRRSRVSSKLFSTGTLSHNFVFKSVYDHGTPEDNEGTTFQDQWVTVDYIFYSTKKDEVHTEDKLKLLSRYRLPTKSELKGINIPNSVVGSDHLSLLAKFKLEF